MCGRDGPSKMEVKPSWSRVRPGGVIKRRQAATFRQERRPVMTMQTTRVDDHDRHIVDRARSRRALGKHVAGAALGGALVRLRVGAAAADTAPAGAGRGRDQRVVHPSLQRIVVDGAELEYEERGTGEPVLLIHGSLLADAFAP